MKNEEINALYVKYIANLKLCFVKKGKPDEAFMRSIEEKMELSGQHAKDFRSRLNSLIMSFEHLTNKKIFEPSHAEFKWDTHPILASALTKQYIENLEI